MQDRLVDLDDLALFEVTLGVVLVRLDEIVADRDPGTVKQLRDSARPRASATAHDEPGMWHSRPRL